MSKHSSKSKNKNKTKAKAEALNKVSLLFFNPLKVFFVTIFALFIFLISYEYAGHENFTYTQNIKPEMVATTAIPILVYHRIEKPTSIIGPIRHDRISFYRNFNVQSDIFEEQMKYIVSQGYTFLTMQELISDEQKNILPAKPIVVTFDDGWRSQYENALPVLENYNIRATFYIYTGVIGSPAYMTWPNLQDLVDKNMEIGDHTKSHPLLTKIDPSRLDEELVQSKKNLERRLHIDITDFAYPYGVYNDSIVEAVKEAGYVSARTSGRSIYNDFKNLYTLKALYAPNDLEAFKKMLK